MAKQEEYSGYELSRECTGRRRMFGGGKAYEGADKIILKKMQLGVADMKNCITFVMSKNHLRDVTPDSKGIFYSPTINNTGVVTPWIAYNEPSRPANGFLTTGSATPSLNCRTRQKPFAMLTLQQKQQIYGAYLDALEWMFEMHQCPEDDLMGSRIEHLALEVTARATGTNWMQVKAVADEAFVFVSEFTLRN